MALAGKTQKFLAKTQALGKELAHNTLHGVIVLLREEVVHVVHAWLLVFGCLRRVQTG
jgi:hypothetical protein